MRLQIWVCLFCVISPSVRPTQTGLCKFGWVWSSRTFLGMMRWAFCFVARFDCSGSWHHLSFLTPEIALSGRQNLCFKGRVANFNAKNNPSNNQKNKSFHALSPVYNPSASFWAESLAEPMWRWRSVAQTKVPAGLDGVNFMHGNQLITVFSASNYCGSTGNQGAVLTFYLGAQGHVAYDVKCSACLNPSLLSAAFLRDFFSQSPKAGHPKAGRKCVWL